MRMTDAEYTFHQDIREKKRIGRGSFNKKCGSRSKKCTLPSDYLTRKEKEKMNSEPETWTLTRYYSFAEFKDMPSDIKVMYLNRLIDKYEISLKVISDELFRISYSYLRKLLIVEDIYSKVHLRTGLRTKKEAIDHFRVDFCSIASLGETVIAGAEVNDIYENPELTRCAPPVGTIKSATISLDGFDMETIEFLSRKYSGRKIEVTINVCIVE